MAIDKPTDHFRTKTYTGNGGTQSITFDESDNMQPDWVWIKDRDDGSSHAITDSVRGNTKYLMSNDTYQEETLTDRVTSFDSNGFSLSSSAAVNQSSAGNVAWCWKTGTSFSNDASATGVGTIDSTGSVNTDAGFSIVSYTGNGTSGTEVAHGLGSTPDLYITKSRSYAYGWGVYHKDIANDKGFFLNGTDAQLTGTGFRNSTAPTSSVFTLGGGSQPYRYTSNKSGETYIGYFFNEVKGYSKFGSYTGNGNADGTFVYTGFRPAWVMLKRTDSTSSWYMQDNKRQTFNVLNTPLYADTADAEGASSDRLIDILSNGFKLRGSSTAINASGGSYIYMAFAESPFVNSSGVPTNAR